MDNKGLFRKIDEAVIIALRKEAGVEARICPTCNGYGQSRLESGFFEICPTCKGDAWLPLHSPTNPKHYSEGMPDGVEVRDILKAQGLWEAFCHANVIKYSLRAKYKNGLEDLKKLHVYSGWLVEAVEERESKNK